MKRTRLTWVTVSAGVIIVVALLMSLRNSEPLPSYKGKTVAQWFEAFEAGGGHGKWLTGGNDECTRAIVTGLGGEALPYLDRIARRSLRPRETEWYSKMFARLPQTLSERIPAPQRDSSSVNALRLIAAIGTHDLWSRPGNASETTLTAVRTLRWALGKPRLRTWACQGISEIGPSAAEAMPELIRLISAAYHLPGNGTEVLGAIGGLQSSASNAVPALTTLLTNRNLPLRYRVLVGRTLGEIGEWAHSAGPAVGQVFVEQTSTAQNGLGLEMALASIGNVPEEAISPLQQLLKGNSGLRRIYAAVALWSCEPETAVYERIVRDALKAPLRSAAGEIPEYSAGPAIAVLSEHGAKALMFEQELEALASSTNHLKHLAENALTRIRGGTNYIQIRKL